MKYDIRGMEALLKAESGETLMDERQILDVEKKKLFVVLGMHRSGTSVIARALQVFDISLGNNLIPAAEGNNPKGFWEDWDVVNLNAEMMKLINSDWHFLAPMQSSGLNLLRERGFIDRAENLVNAKFSGTSMLGIKDPRMARLIPFWKEVFDRCQCDQHYVLALRNPLSVCESLAQRDSLAMVKSYFLWFEHVLSSLRYTQGERRIVLEYDRLLQEPAHELGRVAGAFGLHINPSELEEFTSNFLDHSLRHTAYTEQDLLDRNLPRPIREIYSLLADAAADKLDLDGADIETRINRWIEEFDLLEPVLALADELALRPDPATHRRYLTGLLGVIAKTDSPVLKRELYSHWYAENNPDIVSSKVDPYEHWVNNGQREGRLPAADSLELARELVTERENSLRTAFDAEKQQLQASLIAAQQELQSLESNLSDKTAAEQQTFREQIQVYQGNIAALEQSLQAKDQEHLEALRQAAEQGRVATEAHADRERELIEKLLAATNEAYNLERTWAEKISAQQLVFQGEVQELQARIEALMQTATGRERELHEQLLAVQQEEAERERTWAEKVSVQQLAFKNEMQELQARIEALMQTATGRERELHEKLLVAQQEIQSLDRFWSEKSEAQHRAFQMETEELQSQINALTQAATDRESELHERLLTAQQEMQSLDRTWSEKSEAQLLAFQGEMEELQSQINDLMQTTADRERELHERLLTAQQEMQSLDRTWSEKSEAQLLAFQGKAEELQSQINDLMQTTADRERDLNSKLFAAQHEMRQLNQGWAEKERVATKDHIERERELQEKLLVTQKERQDVERGLLSKAAADRKALEAVIDELNFQIGEVEKSLRVADTGKAVRETERQEKLLSVLQATKLDQVLALDHEGFITAAYKILLGRVPDAEGREFYLGRLRRGISKEEILGQIRSSTEARQRGSKLAGLDVALRKAWWRKLFSFGSVQRRVAKESLASLEVSEKKLLHSERQCAELEILLTKTRERLSRIAMSRTMHLVPEAKVNDGYASLETPSRQLPGFDADWYLKTYPDVADAGVDPLEHYLNYGRADGRYISQVDMDASVQEEVVSKSGPVDTRAEIDRTSRLPAPAIVSNVNKPNYVFDAEWYLRMYPDVATSGMDPLNHYLKDGRANGRFCCQAEVADVLFDPETYLRNNPDVKAAGFDPMDHYLKYGMADGRRGGRLALSLFDADWYLLKNPDVATEGVDPLYHYINDGKAQNRPWSSFKGLDAIEPEPLVFSQPLVNVQAKLITFYLPQFHPIPENDKWWGKGFTEWTNVSRARPFYKNHDQPRLPGELGYYDLRVVDVMKRQADLARAHGVYGFCFYIYWFGGKRLLESPVEMFLRHPEIDINFCFCWANENWTRRWDGLENDVLIGQTHTPEDDIAFISSISGAFNDKRYIRVNGRPMLTVYRPSLLPDIRATVRRWRKWCRDNGIGEIHVCFTESFDKGDPNDFGMDASIQFPPALLPRSEITDQVSDADESFVGQVHNYLYTAKSAKSYARPKWIHYRGVMPSWDNTARKMERGISFYGATPELYAEWLETSVSETVAHLPQEHRFVFINAWNEWGEGAYLEPDRRRGYAYLNRTREVIAKFSDPVVNDERLINKKTRSHNLAIIIHLHYGDLFEVTARYLDNLSGQADLYFSVRDGCFPEMEKTIMQRYPDAVVVSYPNHGRDVVPFLRIYSHIQHFGYKAICKIHSKKSKHRADGDQWRDDVYNKLLGDKEAIDICLTKIEDGAGIVSPAGHLLDGSNYWGSNARRVTELAIKMGCPVEWIKDFLFPAGTMFWFDPKALEPLMSLNLQPSDFEPEAGQVDGTTAHAVERLIGLSARKSNLRIVDTDTYVSSGTEVYQFADRTDLEALTNI